MQMKNSDEKAVVIYFDLIDTAKRTVCTIFAYDKLLYFNRADGEVLDCWGRSGYISHTHLQPEAYI